MLRPIRSSQVLNAFVCVLASLTLEFLPAFGMGLLFPMYVHLTGRPSEGAGRAVGNIYAWNTIGTIGGASMTAALLIPTWGVAGTIRCVLWMYLLAMILQLPRDGVRHQVRQIALTACGCALIWVCIRPVDPRITNSGLYLYGYSTPRHLVSYKELLYYREGASCNVLVTESDGERTLRVNGKVDASSRGDMTMQLGLAYLPRLFLPRAQNVLNIGFGSGASAGASLLFPDTHVTCCEIEPAVFAASKYFHKSNHAPELSSRFRIVFDDGRTYLQGTREKYDLILSEPSNPWLAGVATLFTQEFYETARTRLNNGGILAQWLQAYSLSAAEYSMVVRTFVRVFPHCALLRISEGNTILLGSSAPLGISKDALGAVQALADRQAEIRADLEKYFGSKEVAVLLLQHLVTQEDGLQRLAAYADSTVINSDTNMRLEYEAPLRLFSDPGASEGPQSILLAAADVRCHREVIHKLGWTREHVGALCRVIDYLSRTRQDQLAVQLTRVGMEIAPDEPRLLAMEHILRASTANGRMSEESLDQIVRKSPDHANQMGVALWKANRYGEAVGIFQKLSRLYADSATTWANLGINYEALGDQEKAKAALEKAVSLDPFSELARRSYESLNERAVHE